MKSIITFFFVAITMTGYTQNKLFVNGGVSGIGTSSNSFLGIGSSNSAPTSHLHILDYVDGELSLLLQNTKSPGTRTFLTSTSTRSLIQTDKDFGIFTNGGGWSEKFTVLNNGNVGVGTTVPESNLDVYAPINSLLRIRNEAYSNGSSELRFESKRLSSPGNAAGMVANASGVTQNGVPTETFGIYSQWRPIVFILSNGDGNFKEYLRIAQSGNVGIGTTNPTQKLTVKGTVYSTEVKVDLAAGTGPDYVFEPTYTLPPLDSVQLYINQNKHLPEVPSAKEMEANGVNLGEMNMLLLKKVEELTLYVIELKKEINTIKSNQK